MATAPVLLPRWASMETHMKLSICLHAKNCQFLHYWHLNTEDNILGLNASGSVGKEYACNTGDPDLIPGSGRPLGEGNGNPLQYSCLGKSHKQRSLEDYSPWGHKRVRQDLPANKQWQQKNPLALLCCLSIKENFLILLIDPWGHALQSLPERPFLNSLKVLRMILPERLNSLQQYFPALKVKDTFLS